MSQLKSLIERILVTHAEEDEIKGDRREIYAEAKAAGFDKSALGVAIREIRGRDKAETPAAQERAAIVELYLAEYDGPRTYVHVPASEAERNDPTRETASVGNSGQADAASAPLRPNDGDASLRGLSRSSDCQPDATPAGAVVADTSGVTAGETAAGARDVEATVEQRAPAPLPIAKPIDLTIPAFLDRRIPKPEARQ